MVQLDIFKKILNAIAGSKKRLVISIFLFSLAVRLLLVLPVIKNHVPVRYDAASYYKSASGFYSIFKDLSHFKSPQDEDKRNAYRKGFWPPFHSILLGLGFLLFGKSIAVARIIVIIISAMTTALLFLLTEKISNTKAGIAAAMLHLFYPSFIAFSHYLWAETTYIFLLFLAIYLVIVITETVSSSKRIWLSILLGFILGTLILTRAAGLFISVIILGWLFFKLKMKPDKIIIPAIIMIMLILVISPWEYALITNEKRFVVVSSFAYRNFYIGNNQWMEYEVDFDHDVSKSQALRALRKYAREKSIHVEQAAKELSLQEIKSHFGRFIIRSFKRFLLLWTFDFYPLRHLVNGVYAPMSDAFALSIFLIFVICTILLYLLIIKGFFIKAPPLKYKFLLLVLAIGGAMPYISNYANTRYNLPQVALLLPIAGMGLAYFREKQAIFPKVAVFAVLCVCFSFFYTYKHSINQILRPSSYYKGSFNFLDGIFKTESVFRDIIIIKTNPPTTDDVITLTILNKDNYSFNASQPVKEEQIILTPGRSAMRIVFSQHPENPLLLSVYSEKQNKAVRINPVSRKYWRTFQPLEIENLEIKWNGGY